MERALAFPIVCIPYNYTKYYRALYNVSCIYTMYMLSYTALFPKEFDNEYFYDKDYEDNDGLYDDDSADTDQTDTDQTNPTARPPRSTSATTSSEPITGK